MNILGIFRSQRPVHYFHLGQDLSIHSHTPREGEKNFRIIFVFFANNVKFDCYFNDFPPFQIPSGPFFVDAGP